MVLVLVLVPLIAFAQAMPRPIEKKLTAGISTIDYAGQALRFNTPVPLVVKLEPVSETKFKMQVWQYQGADAPSAGYATQVTMDIYWTNFGTEVYNGPAPPPSAPWEGTLNSESGFTEK
jgi:hypothetical protein